MRPAPHPFDDMLQQVDQDQGVEGEQAGAGPGGAEVEVNGLEGQERGGEQDGEVLGPGFFEVEADALDQLQRGISKDHGADAAEHGLVKDGGLLQDEVDEVGLRVEAEDGEELGEEVVDVDVDEMQGPDAQGDEERGLEQLEDGDQHQELVVADADHGGWHGGSVHGGEWSSHSSVRYAGVRGDGWQALVSGYGEAL